MYLVLSRINQAIHRLPASDQAFQTVCQVLVEQGGFQIASVVRQVPGTSRSMLLAQWNDHHDRAGYSPNLDAHSGPDALGSLPQALREGRPCVCNDVLGETVTLPWRVGDLGVRAYAMFPLYRHGRMCGALNVFSREAGVFEDPQIGMLTDAAAAFSFAFESVERDSDRHHADRHWRAETLFSDTMIESLPGIVYFYDDRGASCVGTALHGRLRILGGRDRADAPARLLLRVRQADACNDGSPTCS